MYIKKIIVCIILAFSCLHIAFAHPVITATTGNQYRLGDIIPVEISISENTGFAGIYFDLTFDEHILSFESIEQGNMLLSKGSDGELLYVHSDPKTSSSLGSHIIIAYSLNNPDSSINQDGILLTLNFRAIGSGSSSGFTFLENKITGWGAAPLEGAIWEDSGSFTVSGSSSFAFISISDPYEGQVYHTDTASVNVICSESDEYIAFLGNLEKGYTSGGLSAASGYIANEVIPLVYGFNRITATLKDTYGNIIANDIVRVYRAKDDMFVDIVYPRDHELLNTDMVDVVVASPFNTVTINGLNARYYGESRGDKKLYRHLIALRRA